MLVIVLPLLPDVSDVARIEDRLRDKAPGRPVGATLDARASCSSAVRFSVPRSWVRSKVIEIGVLGFLSITAKRLMG